MLKQQTVPERLHRAVYQEKRQTRDAGDEALLQQLATSHKVSLVGTSSNQ